MGPYDNPEAFLTTSKRVVLASQWPLEHWALDLTPFLKGQAQLADHNVYPEQAQYHSWVKAAILDYLDIGKETQWQHFRAETYPKGTCSQVIALGPNDYKSTAGGGFSWRSALGPNLQS